MIGQEREKKRGRPKKQVITLDTSMTVEQAKDQKVIAEAKEKIHKAEIQRIKALEANKAVIDTKIVVNLVTDVFTKLKSLFYASSSKLPAQLEGKTHAEISSIMFQFVDETLERMQQDFETKLSNINIDDDQEEEDSVDE